MITNRDSNIALTILALGCCLLVLFGFAHMLFGDYLIGSLTVIVTGYATWFINDWITKNTESGECENGRDHGQRE